MIIGRLGNVPHVIYGATRRLINPIVNNTLRAYTIVNTIYGLCPYTVRFSFSKLSPPASKICFSMKIE